MVSQLSFAEILQVNNEVLFSSNDGEGLYFLDKENKKARIFVDFPIMPNLVEDSYKVLAKVGNKIFLPSCFNEHIAVYDCETENYQILKLESLSAEQKNLHKFWTSIIYDHFIFFVGHYYPAIVKLNIDTMEMVYLTDWVEQIERKRKLDNAPYLGIGIVRDDIAMLPCCCTNAILKLDLKTNKTEVCEITACVDGFNGLCCSKDMYWLTVRNGPEIVVWNRNTDSVEMLKVERRKKYGGVPFAPPLKYQDNLYVFPYWGNYAYCINTFTKKIERIDELKDIFDIQQTALLKISKIIYPPTLVSGKIYFVTGMDKVWHIYDPVKKVVESFPVYIDMSRQKVIKKRRSLIDLGRAIRENNKTFLFWEEELFSGREYSEMVYEYQKEIGDFQSRHKAFKESTGQDIYSTLNLLKNT